MRATLFLRFAIPVAILGIVGAVTAVAQEYPSRPIKLVVANAAGGTPDTIGRLVAAEISAVLGQQLVVENRPGANSTIGYGHVARQVPPDGYTIALVQVGELANLPWVVKDLRFDPLNDLPPIAGLVEGRLALLTPPNAPWKTLGDMVAHAKANPGKLNYGSTSTTGLFPMLALLQAAGIDVAYIPFNNRLGPFTVALSSGEIHMGISGEAYAITLGDKVRVLAVTGERGSTTTLRDVPTFRELGYPQIQGNAFSLNVPVGVPKAARDKLYAAVQQVLRQPDVKARFQKMGLEVIEQNGEQASRALAEAARQSADIARKVGLKPE